MLLRRLVLEDFGLYRGVQEIDLTPRQKRGRTLPVVLFGGKNGAGKSTIFEAILLCLYGRAAIGDRVRQSDYLDYLFQRMHRSPFGLGSTRASVTVEFDFVQAGVRHVYEVTRSWVAARATSASIDVSLDLRQDGQRLDDLDHSHWDDFLKELIPPGLSQLFFFDGEKIQRLAEQDSQELGRSVKSLLNLDLVERLSADLQIYVTRQARAAANDNERGEIDKLAGLRQDLMSRAQQLEAERREVQSSKLDHIALTIDKLEKKLRAEGSELAKVRDGFIAERGHLLIAIKQDEERLRELAGSTLPFALCSSLIRDLGKSLAAANDRMTPLAKKRVTAGTSTVLKQFVTGALEGSEAIDRRARKKAADILTRELRAVLKDPPNRSAVKGVEHLSHTERGRLLSWIESALRDSAPEAKRIGDRLEKATRRLQQIEAALAQAPTEDALKLTVAEVNDAHQHLGAAQQEAKSLDEDLNRVARELADVERRIERVSGKLKEGEQAEERAATVKRSQAALKQYLVAVTELKLRQLEREVTQCFGAICRKGDLVHQIRIDPESFEIALLDQSGHFIPKERLSAGEKQVFAVALLWALGRTSGRPLPVIIDTPLARLDSDHRKLLLERYLPSASHQVLVLSTDTEVDEAAFAALEPSVSHAYHLKYDHAGRFTTADAGYFWSRDGDSETAARPVLHGSR
ncbi:MAG: DNA sulfur modification protein DndD [Vicinamibacterales bacterium]